MLGRYRIVGELGRGGLGSVLRAIDPETGDQVAIKVLSAGRDANQDQRRRFAREAQALAKVRHPGVVRLREAGEHEGVPYIVLDLHEAGSLEDRLRRGPVEPLEVAELGVELAAALAASHAEGVLHRDLKPANVLMTGANRPLLTDFGLARDLQRIGQTQQLTQTGVFVGTPGFWAPEQAAAVTDLGPAVDVYGLGATLYAALTGRPPVVGANLMEIATATLDLRPPRIRSLRPETPPALEAVIMRCLEKDPAERWPSAAALGEALEQVLPPPARAGRPVWVLLAALLSGLGALGLIGAALLPATPDAPGPQIGPSPAPTSPPSVALLEPSASLEPRAPSPAPSLAPDPAAVAERLFEQATAIDRAQGDYARARALLREAIAAGNAKAPVYLGVMVGAGRGGPADPNEAKRLFRLGAERGDPEGMSNLGMILERSTTSPEDLPEARLWYTRAAELGVARSMNNLATLLYAGRGGPQDQRAAIEWWRRAAEAGHPGAMVNLAILLQRGQGVERDLAEAARLYRLAAELGNQRAIMNLALALEDGAGVAQDLAEAARWYQRAVDANEPEAMVNLGLLYGAGRGVPRDPVAAKRLFQAAAGLGLSSGMVNLGCSLESEGALAEAADWYRRGADLGQGEGMVNLGALYQEGRGVALDLNQAARWYRLGAERGNARGMYNLAVMFDRGLGRPRDLPEAVLWYRRAAEANYAPAMSSYGALLQAGEGLAQDQSAALEWFLRAARLGDQMACLNAGGAYAGGHGTRQDLAVASEWYQRAVSGPDPELSATARTQLEQLKRLRARPAPTPR